jgi:dihydroorotate dehydrogenase electron transfer subunit
MPLAYLALNQGASVALCMSSSGWEVGGEPLPLEIEILPIEGLADLLPWADYLVVDLPRESLPQLRRAMRLPADQRASIDVEVLLDTPTPCGGAAECGVCAVKTRRGWKLACKDGPVFDFNLLEEA